MNMNAFENNYNNFFPKICRMCLSIINDIVYIDSSKMKVKEICHDKLYSCYPELDLRPNSKTILCLNCSKIVNIIYQFIYKCNKSEEPHREHLPLSFPSMPNLHLFDNFDITVKDEIKIEEVDLSDTEISLDVPEQIQSSRNKHKYLQSKIKTTLCTVERSLNHSQYNDTIYKNVSKEDLSILTEKKPFKCSYCNYSSNRRDNLKNHFHIHTGEKPFVCFKCNYSSTLKCNLKRHFRIHTKEKPFKCSQCNYSCTQKNNLKRHFHIHIQEKPFKCSQCQYSCAYKSLLINHFRIHAAKEKSFKCFYCDYSSAYKNYLIIHFRTHTGEKPFKCFQCDYNSARKTHLLNHLRTHTGEKPFKCFRCDYSTARKNHLISHFRTHTGEKLFKCTQCHYTCTKKRSLNNHFHSH